MATFTVNGWDVLSSSAGHIISAKAAVIQIVSSLGDAKLDYVYASDDPSSAEITLSNYNMLLNGTHLNDGLLPDRIELFEMSWSDGGASKSTTLLNLATDSDEAARDCLFVIDGDMLPTAISTEHFGTLFKGAEFSRLTDRTAQIDLDEIPGVSIAGVIQKLFEDGSADTAVVEDQFRFFQPSDAECFDAFEFDATFSAETDQGVSEDVVPGFEPDCLDTYLPDPDVGDMAG